MLLSSLGEQRFAGERFLDVPGRRRRKCADAVLGFSPQQLRSLGPQQSSRKHSSQPFRLVGTVVIARKLALLRLRLVISSPTCRSRGRPAGMQSLRHEDRRVAVICELVRCARLRLRLHSTVQPTVREIMLSAGVSIFDRAFLGRLFLWRSCARAKRKCRGNCQGSKGVDKN